MTYSVEITASARRKILEQANYIAINAQAPLNAERWYERVWDVIRSLKESPHRHNFAPENELRPFEIRRAHVGRHFILFTINEEARKVIVIGFRHGSQLPQSHELPDEI